jgi:hypothetical protein
VSRRQDGDGDLVVVTIIVLSLASFLAGAVMMLLETT